MSYSLMIQHQETGRRKCREGRYAEAEQLFKMALLESEQNQVPNVYSAQQMKTLGVFYFATGKMDKAEPYFQKSLELERSWLGPSHTEVCKSLNHLGLLYHAYGVYSQAEHYYQQTLALLERASYDKAPSMDAKIHHLTLHLLAMVYCSQGKSKEALELCKQAAEKIGRNSGPAGRSLSTGIHDVAVKFCDNDPNPEVRKTCGWLLRIFTEQLQTEYLGSVIAQKETESRDLEPIRGMFADSHEILATYDEIWRPANICRDQAIPLSKVIASDQDLRSSMTGGRLPEVLEDSWRP